MINWGSGRGEVATFTMPTAATRANPHNRIMLSRPVMRVFSLSSKTGDVRKRVNLSGRLNILHLFTFRVRYWLCCSKLCVVFTSRRGSYWNVATAGVGISTAERLWSRVKEGMIKPHGPAPAGFFCYLRGLELCCLHWQDDISIIIAYHHLCDFRTRNLGKVNVNFFPLLRKISHLLVSRHRLV
ncbi:hypothetical protein ES703_08254 [subsurface metagenome]